MEQRDERDPDAWVGREKVETDVITAFPARGMAALLDRAPERFERGRVLPECWHWLYFRPVTRRADLGADGHARRGAFLPPVRLPRRMWVGGRLTFHEALRIGDAVERRSTIRSVAEKEGRSGRLTFVTVEHALHGPRGLAVEEEQDLVYREPSGAEAGPPQGEPLPEALDWDEAFVPDPVTLFRFSALTFNGHRIHYDHPYATDVDGYPGLVVHGPLTAILLVDGAKRHAGKAPGSYAYRAVRPLFGGNPMVIAGRSDGAGSMSEVWAGDHERRLAMVGTVDWRDGRPDHD